LQPDRETNGQLTTTGGRAARRLANSTTRRSFIGTLGAGLLALATRSKSVERADAVVPGAEPIKGNWFGFCGHYWTTGSCRGPYRLPRVDRQGRPLRPHDGRPVDDRGRLINDLGQPVDERGNRLVGANGRPLPPGPRTRICQDRMRKRYRLSDAVLQGSWYRCCNGQIRKLWDCCSVHPRRINGDASVKGYCYGRRKVFCVVYYDTGVPC
jgi:hypothetical protein